MSKGKSAQGGYTDYLTVYDGKFAMQVSEPTDESVTRQNKVGKTVHEVFYDYVDGTITNVEKKESEFEVGGRKFKTVDLILDIREADENNQVTLRFYDRATRTVLNKLMNVDFSEPIKLMVGKNKEGHTWFSIKQTGKGYERDIVPNRFVKEDLPEPVMTRIQGNDTWVYDGQTDFIWDKLKETLASKPVSQPAAPEPSDEDEAGSDGLPF